MSPRRHNFARIPNQEQEKEHSNRLVNSTHREGGLPVMKPTSCLHEMLEKAASLLRNRRGSLSTSDPGRHLPGDLKTELAPFHRPPSFWLGEPGSPPKLHLCTLISWLATSLVIWPDTPTTLKNCGLCSPKTRWTGQPSPDCRRLPP